MRSEYTHDLPVCPPKKAKEFQSEILIEKGGNGRIF